MVDAHYPGIKFTNLAAAMQAGNADVIRPGGILNVPCDRLLSSTMMPDVLTLQVDLIYDTNIFGLRYTRCPSTFFVWVAAASNPQWIKGEFAARNMGFKQPEKCERFYAG
ncbi:MAG: hypothetical protein QOC72_6 [Methylobacteriaceae bacterium]|jgi:hypothetical protein|nr:hypothetical protein [Methylobacteriaceae bacterium]